MSTKTLIERVSNFEDLLKAFYDCSRGKRKKEGYQKYLFNYGEKLKYIEHELKTTHDFTWGGYREFYVHDPKKRLVMAAPFRDRIVHTALYKTMEPIVDKTLGCRTFACRTDMGNRKAALRLQQQLRRVGQERYCVKLDVKKYFASINHKILYKHLKDVLPDSSLDKILWSLINSHKDYANQGKGIPIGNLSSQLFANFYLSKIDQEACKLLEINYYEDDLKETNDKNDAYYIRYMDDMVILAKDKEKALKTATKLVKIAKESLHLEIPPNKFVVLGKDPIPFLGYVLDEHGSRVLRRNERKFIKKIKRLKKQGYNLAYRAQVIQSYEAWSKLHLEV